MKKCYFYSISLPFDAQAAEKILNVMYWICIKGQEISEAIFLGFGIFTKLPYKGGVDQMVNGRTWLMYCYLV